MRLSSKFFMALAVLAGSIFGFSPDAGAHNDTAMIGTVVGSVNWDTGNAGILPGGGLPEPAATDGGCGVVNAAPGGLPVLNPSVVDLCFEFTGVTINVAGVHEGAAPVVAGFLCEAAGTSGVDGGGPVSPPNGAFHGYYDCVDPALGAQLPTAQGHFHGTSLGTTIAFMGTFECGPVGPDGACATGLSNPTTMKHTLSCAGEVIPDPTTTSDKDGDGLLPVVGDTVNDAVVTLGCLIT